MKQVRKILALLLVLCMVITMMPLSSYAALNSSNISTLSENQLVDAAIFCSDVHGSTSDASSVFSGIKSSGLNYSTATFVGDTFNGSSKKETVTSVVRTALGSNDIECFYSYGTHDSSSDIEDETGLVYSGEYYIFVISQTDMASSSPDTTVFTNAVANMDKSKPLFIASHVPLHKRRNDNNGASAWYDVISAAAKEMDIVFFWAHNHTNETSVDTAAYYVEKNGDETITIQGGSTVIPNFTYMNAGYINANNQSPQRKGIATTVQIYDDYMVFQDYNSSGKYTGTYAHNVTVEREFAAEEETIPEGAELADIEIVNQGKIYYFQDASELDLSDLDVRAVYTYDGEKYYKSLSYDIGDYTVSEVDFTKLGKQNVTITYNNKTAQFSVYVCAEKLTNEAGISVSFDTECVLSFQALPANSNPDLDGFIIGDYELYDITAEYAEGYDELQGTATVTLPIPDGVENPAVYYVSEDGNDIEAMPITAYGNGTVSFEATHFSLYAIGESNEDAEHTETITEEESTTTGKTVYVLKSTPTADKKYLIVNKNSAGSAYALANNSGSVSAMTVNIQNGTDGKYIELDDASDELWTVGGNYTFKNANYYLSYSSSTSGGNKPGQNNTTYSLALSTSSRSWNYSSNRLYFSASSNSQAGPGGPGGGTSNTSYYYLRYSNSWGISSSSSNVYFYEETTISENTTTTEINTYSVSAEDIEHIYEDNNTTTTIEPAILKNDEVITDLAGTYEYKLVSDPSGIIDTDNSDGSNLSFTGKSGTAYVRVYYTFTKDGTEYTIWTTVKVDVRRPYYTVDITKAEVSGDSKSSGESITSTVSIKGVKAGDTYELWTKVYKNGKESISVDANSLTWVSNNTDIAKVDSNGTVRFTGEEGTVQITVYYAYTDDEGNTVQATDVVTFSVSQELYIIPSDGTSDFPEYPNEGSVRFDKTATSVGSFSQTGIAKMELSMTGVPFSSGKALDVLLMLDMSTSMDAVVDSETNADRVDVTIAATKAFAKNIVQNEDGSYNSNKIAIKYFNGSNVYETTDYISVSSDEGLSALYALIDELYTPTESGTYYSTALEDAYNTITANAKDSENTQALVFMSDGGPTYYTYLNDSGTGTTVGGTDGTIVQRWFNYTSTPYSATDEFKTEYYTYLLKQTDCPVYTVGLGLSTTNSSSGPSFYRNLSSAQQEFITSYILEQMATDSNHFYSIADKDAAANMSNVFASIATSIREAAKDVVVEDMISDEFEMTFKLPNSGVTADEAGMSEFYIQVVEYVLDSETHERTNVYNVLENFTFNENGTLKSHTVDGADCGDSCAHVTFDANGEVTSITGTYFKYYIDADGNEILKWTADKLTGNELALQYFLYLENSAGLGQEEINNGEAIDAGTYPTNKYATLTYTNYLDNECQQEFPVPTMTWKGAQVTYVFYLVNEYGEPVNRAGRVVPFTEAVYVTDPVTYDVTWNEETGSENMLAQNIFASANVPDVYKLYDEKAYYEIRVYQTEGVDVYDGKKYNYFKIDGSNATEIKSTNTTKVFNTKAGIKYYEYGVYSTQAEGTDIYTVDEKDNPKTVTVNYQANDIDYANTTVAFAVVWEPKLVKDVVVVDYGLDVVINVIENDALAAGVTGLMLNTLTNVEMNSGTYTTAVGDESVTKDNLWKASVENLNSVRFHQNNMGMHEPVSFYYEAGVNYYTYDSSNNATLNTTNMYSQVTVIPATMIYYEDEFVTLSYSTKNDDGGYTTYKGWDENSVKVDAKVTQDVDRPGVSQSMSKTYDANNLYGYDSAYENMSQFSMGNAAKVKVYSGKYANAEFEFYGTGFDIISMTDKTTGYILVSVYDENDNKVAYSSVDTYYGYARTAVTDEAGNTSYTWETVDSNSPNALYQVPVIKMSDLAYGKYKVVLTVSYISFFDHTDEEGYDFYLDAIRIYDPCGYDNSEANAAYAADKEAYPVFVELRNEIITAETFNALEDEEISGSVFVDGANDEGAGEISSIVDYTNIGPNNELYLSPGQAIAFKLNATGDVSSVQLAAKTVCGSAKLEIYAVDDNGNTTLLSKEINTATDMFFDITEFNGKTIVIKNAGDTTDSIISLTNIKTTYTAKQTAEATSNLMLASQADISRALAAVSEYGLAADNTGSDEETDDTDVSESEDENTENDANDSEADSSENEYDDDQEDSNENESDNNQTDSNENESESNRFETWMESINNAINNVVNQLSSLFDKWFSRR